MAKNYIVIPTYNERENIGKLVSEIFSLLRDIYIIVVDDNSPDGTAEIVKDLKNKHSNLFVLERPVKNGLGKAYIEAFEKLLAEGDVKNIIMMDADFSHSPKYLFGMLKEMENYDLVIGSRYIKNGGISNWGFWRRLLSWGGNFYVRALLGRKIRDWSSGFNCIRASILKKIDLDKIEFSGYAFLSGLKYFLVKAGARVKEIPIIFEERRGGKSKMSGNIIREGLLAPWKLLFTK